jgi:hypothetical protein
MEQSQIAFGHFTACVGFDKNIFQAEIMDRLINFFWGGGGAIVPNFSLGSWK